MIAHYMEQSSQNNVNSMLFLPCNLLNETSLESATFLLPSSLVRSTIAVVLVALPVSKPPMAVASDGRTFVTTLWTSGEQKHCDMIQICIQAVDTHNLDYITLVFYSFNIYVKKNPDQVGTCTFVYQTWKGTHYLIKKILTFTCFYIFPGTFHSVCVVN